MTKTNQRMIVAVHWLLGVQYLLSGANWWVKMFPFPSIHDVYTGPGKHLIVDVMIASGWMFTGAKLIEIATGLSLLTRRYVPLMLVVSFPLALVTFLLDALIGGDVLRWLAGTVSNAHIIARVLDLIFFGGCVLAMQGYLMLGYFAAYRPMLKARNVPGEGAGEAAALRPCAAFTTLGVVAVVLGVLSTGWMLLMIKGWLIPWSSLAITIPAK